MLPSMGERNEKMWHNREVKKMAWEQRRNGARYYYRSRRVDGKVHKEYFGRGPRAEQAAKEDARRRAEKKACRKRRQQFDDAIAPLAEVERRLEPLVAAALLTTGFYKHHGSWRRRRHAGNENKT